MDLALVFSTGGLVLWSHGAVSGAAARALNSVLQEMLAMGASASQQVDNYTIKYVASNELGLVFAVVYRTLVRLTYADQLVQDMKTVFTSLYSELIKTNRATGASIDLEMDVDRFDKLFSVRVEELAAQSDRQDAAVEPTSRSTSRSDVRPPDNSTVTPDTSRSQTPDLTASPGSSKKKKRSGKQMRRWNDDGQADVDDGAVLDYSQDSQVQAPATTSVDEPLDMANYGSQNTAGEFVLKDLSSELHGILDQSASSPAPTSSAFGFLKKYIGGKTLTPEDISKALAATREQLMRKNVVGAAADHLCEAVERSLVGSTTAKWTSVDATVAGAMTEALKRILTPKTSLDLLHEVQHTASKAHPRRPYVISVVGVNGVGKSTNLSKIGFWLLQNKLKVLVAACDTFRSGAVEQLKVHVSRLQSLTERLGAGQVDIFDQGYGKDAAVIAQKAIEHAQRHGFDVVLIDTAGRRHNDDRLMSSLEKFGNYANPDKIIMVGEALVGTDSVEQARNFDAAFGAKRSIDFFLISKCDTVGDMIGTVVNMTYSTGIPVLFVGVGQNYTDLRTLNVEWAVNLLMT